MTIDDFITEFHFVAVNLHIGLTTTVEYHGRVYSVKKIGPAEFKII